jgi:hypothetical protein
MGWSHITPPTSLIPIIKHPVFLKSPLPCKHFLLTILIPCMYTHRLIRRLARVRTGGLELVRNGDSALYDVIREK